MVLIYAEKPDMAEKIASALGGTSFQKSDKKNGFYAIRISGKEYFVTWGYGHLCTLADASGYNEKYKNWRNIPLPYIPEDFKIVPNSRSGVYVIKTITLMKKLFKEAEYIINATDFDREGELIFYYLYRYLGCKKDVQRMKLSSTTKEGITEAFANLIAEKEVIPIRKSAQCRSIADWIVGCNLTVAMTLKASGREILSIGRVQTPTLAMVVERDEAIENFKPEDYFTVDAIFTTDTDEQYKGTHKQKRFKTKEQAQAVIDKCKGCDGFVVKIEKQEKIKPVPNLYSLDSLQMDANSKYGFPLKRTLDVTQNLYEKGYVTYPRTDCQFLPQDMFEKVKEIQSLLKRNGFSSLFTSDASDTNMARNKGRFFDDTKLGSHYAIIPTNSIPSQLDKDEMKIYTLIASSVIRMLYPNAKLENTKVITEVNGEPFLSSGTSIKEKGWMAVNWETKEDLLPVLKDREKVRADCRLTAKKTEPPKHYTEKTLLGAMIVAGKSLEDEELKEFMARESIDGLGTVATRAGIIETLLTRGVIRRDKKNIISTEKGRKLIHIIPIPDVKSAVLTAQYERKLNLISKGEQDPDAFLQEIYESTKKWCDRIGELSGESVKSMDMTSFNCPVCGKPMRKMDWGYGCSGYNDGCKFSIGTICGKKLTEDQVETLLTKGMVGPLSGFKSKAGKKFNASLKLEEEKSDGKVTGYKVAFVFEEKKKLKDEMEDVYARCPNCGGRIVKGNWGWDCQNGCGVSVPYELCKKRLDPSTAEVLFSEGTSPILEGFISKAGKPFNAGLKLENKKITFVFPERNRD